MRDVDLDDSRALTVSLTTHGADLAARAVRIVEDAEAAFFSAIGDQTALTD